MLTACGQVGQKVHACESDKADAPFHCPACEGPVILKKGRFKIPHFAHEPGSLCTYGAGETIRHMELKLAIYEALKRSDAVGPQKCGIEMRLSIGSEFRIADVLARIGPTLVAIEVQRSVITEEEIRARTNFYTRKSIATLWVVARELQSLEYEGKPFRPNATENAIHSMFLGRAYFHLTGSTFVPVRFEDSKYYVEAREWYSGGDEHSAGGYWATHKSLKLPKIDDPVDLLEDFEVHMCRECRKQGQNSCPLLWMEKGAK